MERKPVITISNVLDNITLEDSLTYKAYLTVGLANKNDFYLEIDFIELSKEDLLQLKDLTKQAKALKFYSPLCEREGYNISNIVITKFTASSDLSLQWQALSDEIFSLEL